MLFTEIELNRPEETFEWVYVDNGDVQPIRVGQPKYDNFHRAIAEMPVGKSLYMALPEGEQMCKFQMRIRTILGVWKDSRGFRWSVRSDKKKRGIYIIKAIEKVYGDYRKSQLPTYPEPMTAKQKSEALLVAMSEVTA